jgi:hypothetical protein
MRFARIYTGVLLLAASLVVTSCGEQSPTAPVTPAAALAPADSAAELLWLLRPTLERTGLLACSPLPEARGSATIGPAGGFLRVGPHTLVVPRGALSAPVEITAVAPSGRVNHVEFQPHGLEFDRPAALTMSYANCNLLGSLLPKRIAYVDDRFNVLEFLLSLDNFWTKRVTGRVDHFSDYVLSW